MAIIFISKHLEVRQNTPPRVLFSTPFWVFGDVFKHGLWCLIYYLNDVNIATVTCLYQILTTLISRDLRNCHCKHIYELVCLWEFFRSCTGQKQIVTINIDLI